METIEVGYRNIGSFGGVEYYHKFLIYTTTNGTQYTISGWEHKSNDPTLPYGYMDVMQGERYDVKRHLKMTSLVS
ncbi:MAG: hypothetical protein PHW18_08235 [Sulfuricurvum sp.]|uniref:hypothetical protein n=1 Tax=Sulfuricurvum sp. TaxID=2025608 RepID=UPI0026026D6E|nr:hypothetical protein [Sulfuricurvum sp.]MDD2829545.1 hypothetical protein [Sulfuricurvum sp.]MDD4950477.1 hypothetical protein [Sulfuricurvum sp.]